MRRVKNYFELKKDDNSAIAYISLKIHATFKEPEYCEEGIPWKGIYVETYYSPKRGFLNLANDDEKDYSGAIESERNILEVLSRKTIKTFKVELYVLNNKHRTAIYKEDSNKTVVENIKLARLIRKMYIYYK